MTNEELKTILKSLEDICNMAVDLECNRVMLMQLDGLHKTLKSHLKQDGTIFKDMVYSHIKAYETIQAIKAKHD